MRRGGTADTLERNPGFTRDKTNCGFVGVRSLLSVFDSKDGAWVEKVSIKVRRKSSANIDDNVNSPQ